MSSFSIGFDIGGTNLRSAMFRDLAEASIDSDGGVSDALVARHREELGERRNPEELVARVAEIVSTLVDGQPNDGQPGDDSELVPVGIGFAGMLSGHEGFVANAPNLGWRDVAFGTMLQDELGPRHQVSVINDVNAISYAEYALGAGAGSQDLLAVLVGTGIGAGAICGGKLLDGANNTAAELGHMKVVLDSSARTCGCGLKGCVEAYVGGAALQKRARIELAEGIGSAAVALAGSAAQVNPGHLDAAAAQGDAYALELFAEVAPLLGMTIANAVTLLNPSRLLLGGGVLSRTPVLREHVLAAFEVAVNPPARACLEVLDMALGEDAGLVGSALLAAH